MEKIILLALAIGAASLPAQSVAAGNTQTENSEEASASGLRRGRDPDAIRCQRRRILGSLNRTKRFCLTNRQWREIFLNGNRDATDLINRGRLYAPPG